MATPELVHDWLWTATKARQWARPDTPARRGVCGWNHKDRDDVPATHLVVINDSPTVESVWAACDECQPFVQLRDRRLQLADRRAELGDHRCVSAPCLAYPAAEPVADPLPGPVVRPGRVIAVQGVPVRVRGWQRPPLAARRGDVEDRVDDARRSCLITLTRIKRARELRLVSRREAQDATAARAVAGDIVGLAASRRVGARTTSLPESTG